MCASTFVRLRPDALTSCPEHPPMSGIGGNSEELTKIVFFAF
jgi:hypothetical protein